MKKSIDKGSDFLFFPFTPKPATRNLLTCPFQDKLRSSAADLHATGFPGECVVPKDQRLLPCKNCDELRVQPTPGSFLLNWMSFLSTPILTHFDVKL